MIVGTRVRLSATFTTLAGVLFNPSAVALDVDSAAGRENPSIVQLSTGKYYADLLLTTSGYYRFSWQSTATGQEVIAEGKFAVLPQTVVP